MGTCKSTPSKEEVQPRKNQSSSANHHSTSNTDRAEPEKQTEQAPQEQQSGTALASLAKAGEGDTRPTKGEDGEKLEYASSCYIPTSWVSFPLIEQKEYSADSKVYSFALPEGQGLDLPVCSCILTRTPDGQGARPYTPISSGRMKGRFELLIKRYDQGLVSNHIDSLKPGDKAWFKHVSKNVKVQHPFPQKKIGMVCGGTGITPMFQAIQKIVEELEHPFEVVCLYGNRSPQDILLRAELDDLVERSQGRVKIVHVVSGSKAPIPDWDGEKGWVDEERAKKYLPPPEDDPLIMVCGLPALYRTFCGMRDEDELPEGSVLQKLGYKPEQVVKF